MFEDCSQSDDLESEGLAGHQIIDKDQRSEAELDCQELNAELGLEISDEWD